MLLIPYQVDVPMYRWPVANYVIIGLTSLISLLAFADAVPVESMIFLGDSSFGWVGHLFLHADVTHLVGNMIFLWVFGNAVCAKIGNLRYAAAYFGLGLLAAASHAVLSGGTMAGASGAINGIIGLYLILYPRNNISCAYFLFIFVFIRFGTFVISSVWMILLWLGFDLLGVFTGGAGIAYWAHIGGFVGGAILGIGALLTGVITMTDREQSLLNMLGVEDGSKPRVERYRRVCAPATCGPAVQPMPVPAYTDRSGPLVIPLEPERGVIPVTCECGKRMRVPVKHAGARIRCRNCQATIRVPC